MASNDEQRNSAADDELYLAGTAASPAPSDVAYRRVRGHAPRDPYLTGDTEATTVARAAAFELDPEADANERASKLEEIHERGVMRGPSGDQSAREGEEESASANPDDQGESQDSTEVASSEARADQEGEAPNADGNDGVASGDAESKTSGDERE